MSEKPRLTASFLTSAANIKQCPQDETVEIAFVGRSNAGKSSSFNRIMGSHGLARVSKTPGRTRLINLFSTSFGLRVADLPGYGYAKASKKAQQGWNKAVDQYLAERPNLHGLVVVMDARHPLKPFDQSMITWAEERELNVLLLLNKSDKLKRNAQHNVLREVQAYVEQLESVQVLLFSAQSGRGLEDAVEWFGQFA